MCQPSGRVLPQHANDTYGIQAAPQASKGFEHGQIRFSCPILLGTLPVTDAYHVCGRHLRHKGIDERGLPNPCLTGDQYELVASLLGHSPPLLKLRQFPLTCHDQRW